MLRILISATTFFAMLAVTLANFAEGEPSHLAAAGSQAGARTVQVYANPS